MASKNQQVKVIVGSRGKNATKVSEQKMQHALLGGILRSQTEGFHYELELLPRLNEKTTKKKTEILILSGWGKVGKS